MSYNLSVFYLFIYYRRKSCMQKIYRFLFSMQNYSLLKFFNWSNYNICEISNLFFQILKQKWWKSYGDKENNTIEQLHCTTEETY